MSSADLAVIASLIKTLAEIGAVTYVAVRLFPQLRVQIPPKKQGSGAEGSK